MNCLPCLVLSRSVLSVPTICPFLFSLYTDLIDSYLFLTRMLEKNGCEGGKRAANCSVVCTSSCQTEAVPEVKCLIARMNIPFVVAEANSDRSVLDRTGDRPPPGVHR